MRNKVKRKLRKYGMPRDAAKLFANNYKDKLVKYGSIQGLGQYIKSSRNNEVKEENIDTDNKISIRDSFNLINTNKPSTV